MLSCREMFLATSPLGRPVENDDQHGNQEVEAARVDRVVIQTFSLVI